jgi:hypothetical protein
MMAPCGKRASLGFNFVLSHVSDSFFDSFFLVAKSWQTRKLLLCFLEVRESAILGSVRFDIVPVFNSFYGLAFDGLTANFILDYALEPEEDSPRRR